MLVKKEWFNDWFDSPYYHVLYSNRDEKEAHFFLSNLVEFLGTDPDRHRMIDLACGKGRHSIFLNSLGYEVLGVDLAEHSIAAAKESENSRLKFEVQDLRKLSTERTFQVALNLFTSFGYFNSKEEDEQVLRNIYQILDTDGIVVIDFMNAGKTRQQLIPNESKSLCGIRFHISKWTENDFICKKIAVDDDDQTIEFTEKVQALTPDDFHHMLSANGFRILSEFGDYRLTPFSEAVSDRYILIAQKVD